MGRPPAFTPEKIAYALSLLAEPPKSMGSIAQLLGISRATLYTHLPELKAAPQARPQQVGAVPRQAPGQPGAAAVAEVTDVLDISPTRG